MANSPNPDYVKNIMKSEFGTEILITNPIADRYLKKSKKNPPKNRLSRWCGGKDGFDDYAEWLWSDLYTIKQASHCNAFNPRFFSN